MKLAIFGATGGTGQQVAEQALAAGHAVRALVRTPGRVGLSAAVAVVHGDVRDARAVEDTVSGADAVLSCLGSKLSATFTARGRFSAAAMTRIVEAMRSRAVRRLVVVSTYGAGDSWPSVSLGTRSLLVGLLWGELADKNAMEAVVIASGLDWTIVRPVNLNDGPPRGIQLADATIRVGLRDWISRADVAAFMLAALADRDRFGCTCVIKGAR